tara:strand:+ start:346 stop:612 length:267 start_codon:yes stop_codon:yes gene_type:complete
MVTAGAVALARFALGGAARGGRFFGAMLKAVARTAHSVRRRARRVSAIVLIVFWHLLSEQMLSGQPKQPVLRLKALSFRRLRAMAWPQ